MEALLKSCYGDCKHLAISNCSLKSSYHTLTTPKFYVYYADDNQPVQIVEENEDHQLVVSNPACAEVGFIKTDKCLFADNVQKCDCVLYSTTKLFFVEIKWSSAGGRNAKRIKAVEQLAATIESFQESGVDCKDYEAGAIICFKRKDVYPTRASSNSQKAIFLEKYGVRLEEGNVIEF
ncbi:hypothetical protein [Chitinophaga sp. sic0106]|uniref:hypothetical protein n=1 Tax=Chitinophaga sp. sic0106 TaxID=2854785 RepID=UPI001C445C1C|nr:hypothetical protein [Chitinophaga sp. sic0106]MBV7529690.1 hypothetical protein [Chitinophaga sp. sic0106]